MQDGWEAAVVLETLDTFIWISRRIGVMKSEDYGKQSTVVIFPNYHSKCQAWDMEMDNTKLPAHRELNISQPFYKNL